MVTVVGPETAKRGRPRTPAPRMTNNPGPRKITAASSRTGTNVTQGKAILANSGLAIIPAEDLGDAAQKIVAEVKQEVFA